MGAQKFNFASKFYQTGDFQPQVLHYQNRSFNKKRISDAKI